jgi:hypothetical protein
VAPPKGQFGNRLDTAAGRAKEALMVADAQNAQRAAAQAADERRIAQQRAEDAKIIASRPPTTDGGGGGETAAETAAEVAQRLYYEGLETDRKERNRQEREGAKSFLNNILTQYGLGSLAGNIESLINDWGPNTEVIAEKLKQTEPYKVRFKGLTALQQRGITDIRNEGEYLNLESQYRQVFRESGLQNFLGQAGTQTEFDAIAKLAGDFSVSVNEVRDRVSDAQRVVAETPQEVRDSLQKFYNVDPATLVSYVLDPTRTSTEINRRANAAIVGGFATRAGLEFGAGVSERVGEFFGRGGDISGTALEPELTQIAGVQRSTKRLADIEKGLLSAEESALSTLDLDIEAKEKVRGLQSRERARFGGTSALTSASLSRGKVI